MDEQRAAATSGTAAGGPWDADDTAAQGTEVEAAAPVEPPAEPSVPAAVPAADPGPPVRTRVEPVPPIAADAAAEPSTGSAGAAGSDPEAGEAAPAGTRRRWPKTATVAGIGAGALIAAAGAALFLLGDGLGTLGGLAARLPAHHGQQQEQPPADGSWGRVGDPVTSGAFEFTVTGVRTGLERVGGPVQGEHARGRFAIASVTVRNTGEEATMFTDADQLLVDAAGGRYRPDNTAGLRAGNSDDLFRRLGPGKQVSGGLVFDLPSDSEPAALRLKDFTSEDDPAVVRLNGWERTSGD